MFVKKKHAVHDFELNLTPIIDCFVTLICFLLLSATYVNLVGMDAKVPVTVTQKASESQPEKEKFKIDLNIKKDGSIALAIVGAGSLSGQKNFAAKDYKSLHDELVRVKKEHPKEFSIYFASAIDMPYEELVRYMDTTRNLDPADGTFTFKDERNGTAVKVDLLFPDFVMAGLATEKEF